MIEHEKRFSGTGDLGLGPRGYLTTVQLETSICKWHVEDVAVDKMAVPSASMPDILCIARILFSSTIPRNSPSIPPSITTL